MSFHAPVLRCMPMIGHLGLVTVGFVALVGFPPAQGAMMLIPLTKKARSAVVPVAIDHGARLVSAGPYGGSMRIDGRRDHLFLPLLAHGIIVVAAPRGGCGADVGGIV